jgi:hypothetical protein
MERIHNKFGIFIKAAAILVLAWTYLTIIQYRFSQNLLRLSLEKTLADPKVFYNVFRTETIRERP